VSRHRGTDNLPLSGQATMDSLSALPSPCLPLRGSVYGPRHRVHMARALA